jgi:hypothetical protein
MTHNQASAMSVGLLVTAWTFLSLGYLEPRVLTWVTFFTWASFFAAGGGTTGLARSIASGIVGVGVSVAVVWFDSQLGLTQYHLPVRSLLLGLLGAVLCLLASLPLLSCIPASFIGAATFFAAGTPMDMRLFAVLTSIVIGALLGLASQKLAGVFVTRTGQKTTCETPVGKL